MAGFVATAVSYGPARMGFGLFVPEFQSTFSMSAATVGLVSSLGFSGFFIGLLAAQFLLRRQGPKVPVLSGLFAATFGMGLVSIAPNLPVLAVGVFLAASSAGFAWTPFNDAVHRKIADGDRPAALSEISTGTSFGIVLAGLLSLGMTFSGWDWRVCWALFAGLGALATWLNWASLRHVERAKVTRSDPAWKDLKERAAVPLFAIAFVFGITSAVYISFAPDHFADIGGIPGVPASFLPALVFIFFGSFGLLGMMTGQIKDRVGLPWMLRILMLAGGMSMILVAAIPDKWAGLILSAGLQGVNVMMISAILAVWSERLFPTLPAFSFTAALLATAAGSMIGPSIAGVISDSFGAEPMFFAIASLPVITALILCDRNARERPADLGDIRSS